MNATFTLYGWHLSYYSGKVRCYLEYKNIPYVDRNVDFPTLMLRIPQKTGAAVMPVLVTPERDWLQDSSVIIDRMEERFPARPVLPESPVQRFASTVLEAWADEFWVPLAMHTRWSFPENLALFEDEAGSGLLPWAPRFVQRRVAQVAIREMRGHLPAVGIRPAQFSTMENWARNMLDLLDAHFATMPYLLGDRPTLGDFALAGPMYGHLGRDPWPKRNLVAPRKNLRAWIDRMAKPMPGTPGDLFSGDQIPVTLVPVFRAIFAEFLPMLVAINAEVARALPTLAPGRALPRGLGDIEFPMGKDRFRRAVLPYTLWMAQRSLDVFRRLPSTDQEAVREWLRPLGGEGWLGLDIPRLRRVALRVAPEVSVG